MNVFYFHFSISLDIVVFFRFLSGTVHSYNMCWTICTIKCFTNNVHQIDEKNPVNPILPPQRQACLLIGNMFHSGLIQQEILKALLSRNGTEKSLLADRFVISQCTLSERLNLFLQHSNSYLLLSLSVYKICTVPISQSWK